MKCRLFTNTENEFINLLKSTLEKQANGQAATATFFRAILMFNPVNLNRVDNKFKSRYYDKFNVAFNIDATEKDAQIQVANVLKMLSEQKTDTADENSKIQDIDTLNTERFGYNSVEDREYAKQNVVATLVNIFNKTPNNISKFTKEGFYYRNLMVNYLTYIKERAISDGKLTEAEYEKIKNNYSKECKKIEDENLDSESLSDLQIMWYYAQMGRELSNYLDMNVVQNKNLIALFSELANDMNLFKLIVFSDSRANSIFSSKNQFGEMNEELAIDEEMSNNTEVREDENPDVTDTFMDMTLFDLEHHDGLYTNYLKHIKDDVKVLLSSLPVIINYNKQNAVNENDDSALFEYDLNNPLGLPSYIDFERVSKLLMSRTSKVNKEEFIKSVEEIADKLHGMKGLHCLVHLMKTDDNVANKIMSTFGKQIVDKLKLDVSDVDFQAVRSNQTTDAEYVLKYQLFNTIKNIIPSYENFEEHILSLKSAYRKINIDADNINSNDINNIIDASITYISTICPDIDKEGIYKYLTDSINNKEFDKVRNFVGSLVVLNNTIEKSKLEYDDIQAQKQAAINSKKYRLLDELNGIEYAREVRNQVENIVKTILPYCYVKIDLTSANAVRNLSSDVINDSWIINRLQVIKDNAPGNIKTALYIWGQELSRTTQSDFDNFLVEHTDENGEIINVGLFKIVNGEYIPTNYAHEIFNVYLFDGANNTATNEQTLYTNMSYSDYVATGIMNYFNPVANDTFSTGDVRLANYFAKTPSDKPKNFVLAMPKYPFRYKSMDLFEDVNKEERAEIAINTFKEEAKDNIGKVKSYFDTNLQPIKFEIEDSIASRTLRDNPTASHKPANSVTTNQFINHITNRNKSVQINGIYGRTTNKNGETYAIMTYTINGETIEYILTGKLQSDGVTLSDIKFDGFLVTRSNEKKTVDDILNITGDKVRDIYEERLLKEGKLIRKTDVNRNHPTFKQIRNIHMQELQDAYIALSCIFQINPENGSIVYENNMPIFREEFDVNTDFSKVPNFYQHYHFRGEGPIFEIKGNKLVFTKNAGKVFDVFNTNNTAITTTSLHTVNRQGNIIDFAREATSEAFDVLSFTGKQNRLIKTNGRTIVLNRNQQQIVDNMVANFMVEYNAQSQLDYAPFIELIPGSGLFESRITEFAFNTFVTNCSFDHIFSGNPKFYKDIDTTVKREAQLQGSGVPYGIKNIRGDVNSITERPNTALSTTEFFGGYKVIERDGFRAVTIKNTIKTDVRALKAIRPVLIESFEDKGYTEKEAAVKAGQILYGNVDENGNPVSNKGGHQSVTINDAQSYITFDEWIRRINARGQLKEYKPLIDAILDESKPVPVDELKKFVQVQKNFYYDQTTNSETKIRTSRQIKNAEFVLIPRFIKGTELEQVYNIMMKNGIDQLNTAETSKAAKTNIYTIWNDDGVTNEELLREFDEATVADESKEIFSYNNLYTQQETPQHMNTVNKLGIQTAKKIIDNISDEIGIDGKPVDPRYENKQQYMQLLSENIKQSAIMLFDELGIQHDEHGNLVLDELSDEAIVEKFDKLFERLRDDARRQGLNSNLIKTFTLIDDNTELLSNIGVPMSKLNAVKTVIPLYFGTRRLKVEAMAQSLFSNNITKQLISGYHGIQVTNVGWNVFGNGKFDSNGELRYHPNGAPYIEIGLPRSAFDLSPELQAKSEKELLGWTDEQGQHHKGILEERGLTKQIIYRIPTEGKQSMCVAKVVKFIDDTYGSTILVPDEWVAQTGSDFDVDSIYAITYHTWNDKAGMIHRNRYFEATDKTTPEEKAKIDRELYKMYVQNRVKPEDKKAFKAKLRVHRKKIREAKTEEEKKKLRAETPVFDYINYGNLTEGILTFEEYTKQTYLQRNTQIARSNKMLDCMIDILSNKLSLEENVSQSKFTDILAVRNELQSGENAESKRRKARDFHNFLDQAEYQAELMSGRILKARSVIQDNFASISNTVKASLNKEDAIRVIYNLEEYDYNMLVRNFGNNVHKIDNKTAYVDHVQYGWSYTNRNSKDEYITVYTSQTTAHSLDVAKEGIIPNVNNKTFGVYKLFTNIGSDYETSVSFMMQPGMKLIADAINENDSIYERGNFNPIHTAIKRIAKELGVVINNKEIQEYTPINDIIKALNDNYRDEFAKLFNLNDEYQIGFDVSVNQQLAFDGKLQKDRIKETGIFETSPVESKLLYDLGIVLQYHRLAELDNRLSQVMNKCNADSFGAKASIYEAYKLFTDIIDQYERCPLFATNNEGQRVNFLEAIYPGILWDGAIESTPEGETYNKDKCLDNFVSTDNGSKSKYPQLYYFFKNSTMCSVKVNRRLFATQEAGFRAGINTLRTSFTHGRYITKDLENEFVSYILSDIYQKVDYIKFPLIYDITSKSFVTRTLRFESEEEAIAYEQRRIYGYGRPAGISYINKDGNEVLFNVNDTTNPTKAELREFAELSPAQKVAYMKIAFGDIMALKYLDVQLHDRFGRTGKQQLIYKENNDTDEAVFKNFDDMYFNANPLFKMTAMDLVKYSMVVEGNSLSRRAVSKMIHYPAYIQTNAEYESIIDQVERKVQEFIEHPIEDSEKLVTRFIRSHPNLKQIALSTLRKNKNSGIAQWRDGMIRFPPLRGSYDENTSSEFEGLIRHNIIYKKDFEDGYAYNKFVRLKIYRSDNKSYVVNTYKIVPTTTHTILVPLNNLEINENSNNEYSVNERNNNFLKESFYDWFIEQLESVNGDIRLMSVEDIKVKEKDSANIQTNIDNSSPLVLSSNNVGYRKFISDINSHYSQIGAVDSLYLRNNELTKTINKFGARNSRVIRITTRDITGAEVVESFVVTRIDTTKLLNKYYSDKYFNNRKDGKIVINNNKPLQDALNNFLNVETDEDGNTKYLKYNDLFHIRREYVALEEDDDVYESAITGNRATKNTQANRKSKLSLIESGLDAIKQDLVKGREEAIDSFFRMQQGEYFDAASRINSEKITENPNEAIKEIAKYAKQEADRIITTARYFHRVIKDDKEEWFDISSPTVAYALKTNEDIRNKLSDLILDTDNFLKRFADIADIITELENGDIKTYYEIIKQAVDEVRKTNIIQQAFNNYIQNYVAKLSNNPLINDGVIDIMDGYYITSFVESWIGDIQENPNPLIQVLTKDMMSRLDAARHEGTDKANAFVERWDEILKEAADANSDVDINKLIDANGNLVPLSTDDFVKELDALREEKERLERENADSQEALRAEYNYKTFLAHNVEQRLPREKYLAEIQNMEKMLRPENKGIYEAYIRIQHQLNKLYEANRINPSESATNLDIIIELNKKIKDLRSPFYFNEDGYLVPKPSNGRVNSKESAAALDDYLNRKTEINKRFYKEETDAAFEIKLKQNLKIIAAIEESIVYDDTNVIKALLSSNEEYRKAKIWLAENARYEIPEDIRKQLDIAYDILGKRTTGKKNANGAIIRQIMRKYGKYDSFGEFDASQIPEEQLAIIKHWDTIRYYGITGNVFNETHLINCVWDNTKTTQPIYTAEFYRNLKIDPDSSFSERNQIYSQAINDINNILLKCYNFQSHIPETYKLSIEDLQKLKSLYDVLRNDKPKYTNEEMLRNAKRKVRAFRKANCVSGIKTGEFKFQYDKAKEIAEARYNTAEEREAFVNAWLEANATIRKSKDGVILRDKKGQPKYSINRYLYGYIRPKDSVLDKYYDNKAQQAIKTIEDNIIQTPNSYYYEAKRKAIDENRFEEWQATNHVYNPRLHKFVPLSCWTKNEYKVANKRDFNYEHYVPTAINTTSVPQKINPNYKPHVGHRNNYSINGNYNRNELNSYELKLRRLIIESLEDVAHLGKVKQFLGKGKLPYVAKRNEGVTLNDKLNKAKNFLGWVKVDTGQRWITDEEIDYGNEELITFPYMEQLLNASAKRKPNKEDYRLEDGTIDEEKYQKDLEAVNAHNQEIHNSLLDRDYRKVIAQFIMKSTEFNSVYDNRRKLFMIKKAIENYEIYDTSLGRINLKRENKTNDDYNYKKKKDKNAIDQYNNFVKRLLYNVYKEDHGVLSKMTNSLQMFTSAKFMMGNIHGGIANFTLGYSQIFSEAVAREYFNRDQLSTAFSRYIGASWDLISNVYSKDYKTIEGQLMELFDVIDYEQIKGTIYAQTGDIDLANRIRNAFYTPQTATEHVMQQSVMLAMMESHRIILNDKYYIAHDTPLTLVTEEEYITKYYEKAFEQMLTSEQKEDYKRFVDNIKKDPNKLKDYAWFKKNLINQFMLSNFSVKQLNEFRKARKEIEDNAKKEFEKLPTFASQFAQDENGKLCIAKDAKLQELNKKELYNLYGTFQQKVKSVNKKIHGVYDKMGSARLEKTLFGGVIMQYHKHIWPGILKRYRVQGMFNENRGTIEKGYNLSLLNFLSIPFDKVREENRKHKELTDQSINCLEAIQSIMKHGVDFLSNVKLYYSLLPPNEQANIRRWVGDWQGKVVAMLGAALVYGLFPKGDDDDTWYNIARGLAIYEFDRLNTESSMWNPIGFYQEAKTLYSSPLACNTTISDIFKQMGVFAEYLFGDEDFSWTYETGIHHGENKVWVGIERNIPVWRAICRFRDMDKSNRFYRVGEKSFEMKAIKEALEH